MIAHLRSPSAFGCKTRTRCRTPDLCNAAADSHCGNRSEIVQSYPHCILLGVDVTKNSSHFFTWEGVRQNWQRDRKKSRVGLSRSSNENCSNVANGPSRNRITATSGGLRHACTNGSASSRSSSSGRESAHRRLRAPRDDHRTLPRRLLRDHVPAGGRGHVAG